MTLFISIVNLGILKDILNIIRQSNRLPELKCIGSSLIEVNFSASFHFHGFHKGFELILFLEVCGCFPIMGLFPFGTCSQK